MGFTSRNLLCVMNHPFLIPIHPQGVIRLWIITEPNIWGLPRGGTRPWVRPTGGGSAPMRPNVHPSTHSQGNECESLGKK